jgi:transcription termination factor Rho
MLERSVLESKDREQLLAIAQALGVKSVSRAKKVDLIAKILEQTGVDAGADASGVASAIADASEASVNGHTTDAVEPAAAPAALDNGATVNGSASAPAAPEAPADEVVLGPDGEPLAEWEIALAVAGEEGPAAESGPTGAATDRVDGEPGTAAAASIDGQSRQQGDAGDAEGDGEGRRRRRRRRGRNRDDGPQGQDRVEVERADRGERQEQPQQGQEPISVSGYLDLRDEGYGFLRVNGYLASRDDAYVSVKQTRQYGLRKGDHVTGLMRPAGRNEKNSALLEVHTVNGSDPEKAKQRPRFEDLTPLFPDEKLRLENPADPTNMTARIIDLISPIGKGQRGLIVSPPKAGKTTVMKTIATSIERNNPEVKLIVLLIDERPEEVTDVRRTVQGEVISSTFDRPSDEHTHVAELAIEKAKRLVEAGEDVVIILDGITRLSRAYNLAAPATGRIMSGGIDAGALYPPKKFFGAARNIEEGGSLTILATALVDTNSRMDDAIFEEFKGTGNMELRLDRKLSERRVYPAIDVDASSTRHEELLFDRKQLQMVWKLRRVLSGLAADGNAAPGLELLIDRLKTFRTNDEFLTEIAKQPGM